MDNLDKLIEAVEHPNQFSESELQALLADPENRELYRMMCASRAGSFIKDSDLNNEEIAKQWELFENRHRKRSLFSWLGNRKIAAVVGLIIASCSIIVVGVSLSNQHIKKNEIAATQTAPITNHLNLEDKSMQSATRNDTIIVFENETLYNILQEASPYYNVKVDLKNPQSKEVRLFLKWDSTTDLIDLIEQLNSFDRINLFLKEDTITDY